MTGPVIPIASESSGSQLQLQLPTSSTLSSPSNPPRNCGPPLERSIAPHHHVALLRLQHSAAFLRSPAAAHHPRRRYLLPAAEGSLRCEGFVPEPLRQRQRAWLDCEDPQLQQILFRLFPSLQPGLLLLHGRHHGSGFRGRCQGYRSG